MPLFFLVFLLCLFQVGCSASTEYQEQMLATVHTKDYDSLKNFDANPKKVSRLFGDSAPYFLGLHYLAAGNEEQALNLFAQGTKSKNTYVAFSSTQQLSKTGDASRRLEAVRTALKNAPDNLTFRAELAELFYDSGDYKAVVTETALPQTTSADKKIVSVGGAFFENRQAEGAAKCASLALLALLELKSEDFIPHTRTWFLQYPVGVLHREFYERLPQKDELIALFGPEYEQLDSLMRLRLAVFRRNYSQAVSYASLPEFDFAAAGDAEILTNSENEAAAPLFLQPQVLSDLGRAYLYGTTDKRSGAARFEQFAQKVSDPQLRFLAWFYAGRLYALSGAFGTARSCFEKSMAAAPLPENYDNALWYFLDLIVKEYPAEITNMLELYAPLWKDGAYFQDLLDYTAYKLVSSKRWNDLVRVTMAILTRADGESRAKYSYITARLIQEGLAISPFHDQTPEEAAAHLLREAFEGDHTNLYYRFLSADLLEIPVEDVVFSVLKRREKPNFVEDKAFSDFLFDHARFGFPEQVYALYRENPDGVSTLAAERLSAELSTYGGVYPRMFSDSLRVISLGVSRVDAPITREILELLYPRPYLEFVQSAAERFYVPEYILYGLIRSESFFDKDVISHAGAIGLTQLMRPTAGDIASKLKLKEYDLLDAATNIDFGTWYYSYLLDRLEYSPILALFAYNGGMGRVRSWVKTSSDLPPDLFLEAIPYAETREYGRKVLASAALYGYLYYEKEPHAIVKEIIR